MLAPADLGDLGDVGVAQAEDRGRTAGAAGLKLAQGADVVDREQLRLHGTVHPQGGVGGTGGKKVLRHRRHPGAEGGNVLPPDREASGQLMAAVAFEQVGDLGQGGKEVEAAVAPGGSLAPSLGIQADQEGRAVIWNVA